MSTDDVEEAIMEKMKHDRMIEELVETGCYTGEYTFHVKVNASVEIIED